MALPCPASDSLNASSSLLAIFKPSQQRGIVFPVNIALRVVAQGQTRPCPALCCPRLPVTGAGARPLPGAVSLPAPRAAPRRLCLQPGWEGKARQRSRPAQERGASRIAEAEAEAGAPRAQRPRAPAWDSAASSAALGLALLRGAAGGCCTAAEEDGVNSGLLRRRSNGLVFQSASTDVLVPVGLNTQVTK